METRENNSKTAVLGQHHPLKVICNDFLVVKVNCWSHVFNRVKRGRPNSGTQVIPAPPRYLKIGDKLFSSVWLTSSPALQKVNINVLILCFTVILIFGEYFVKMCVFLSGLCFHLFAVIHRNVDQLRQCSYYIVGHSVRH